LYLTAPDSRETQLQIWELLQKLNESEVNQVLVNINRLSPLLELLTIQRNFTAPGAKIQQRLNNWKTKHPQHSFASQWPDTVQIALEAKKSFTNTLVFLPLSGNRATQGKAIQDGILAASLQNPEADKSIVFVDSNAEESVHAVNFNEYDLVIGPLLRENIKAITPLIPDNVISLNLNRLEQPGTKTDNHYYFSLAPEDEAEQLANYLISKGYSKPLTIVASGNTYRRMQETFDLRWHALTNTLPQSMQFTNNSELRKQVNEALSLSDSKKRVTAIKRLLRPRLHSVERNRRDIDVIVVFANSTQTELINPLLEASISPFAEIVPVYATSRSFSRELNNNDKRDLRNLFVMDMPWMLESRKFAAIRRSSEALWPSRRDSQQRLFALGYDAYNVASQLGYLKALPGQTWQGLTGKLKLDNNNQLKRRSKLAQLTESDIINLESD